MNHEERESIKKNDAASKLKDDQKGDQSKTSDNRLTKEQLQILKRFRENTGHSIKDCKETLVKFNFNEQEADDFLKKKYATKYALLSGSTDFEAPEFVAKVFFDKLNGIFGYATVRTKSDMVTRSEKMRDLLIKAFDFFEEEELHEHEGFDKLSKNDSFSPEYDTVLAYFREPIKFEKLKKRKLAKGEVVASYSHNIYHKQEGEKSYAISKSSAPVILKYEGELSDEDVEKIRKLTYVISMSIIGSSTPNSKVFFKEELSEKIIEDFKNQKIEEAKKSGKPEKAIEKIVEGQIDKFLKENLIIHLTLVSIRDLPWLKPDGNCEITIEDAIKQTGKELNCDLSVSFYKVLTDK